MKTSTLFLLGLIVFNTLQLFADTVEKTTVVSEEEKEAANLYYIKGKELLLNGKVEEAIPLLERVWKTDQENPYLNHQLAEANLRVSNYEKAEEFGKKAVEKDAKNTDYRMTLGAIYASLKKFPEAKEQYSKIHELEPENTRAPLLIAILSAESGQMDQAIKELTQIVDGADSHMALFYRAKIYIETDKLDKAKDDLEKCLSLRPSFVEAGTALGLIYERNGEVDQAIKAYSRIQGSGQFKKRLATLYIQKNDLDKAVQALTEYEGVEPDDYTARVKLGLIYFEMRKLDKASETFQAVLKEQPDSDSVRFYLGWTLEEDKKYDEALKQFAKVKKDSNFFKEASLHKGYIFKETGKLKEGLEFARKLILQNPKVVEFFDLEASLYDAQKNYKKALSSIEKGLKQSPEDEKLLYFQGAVFDKVNERKKAIETMKKIVAKNPNNPHALNFLGYTYAESGENLDEAEKYILQAIKLRPNDGFVEDSLGWVYFKRGEMQKAITQLEKAVALQPEEAIILEHLGDAYLKNKDFVKAQATYQKAIACSEKKDKELAKKLTTKLASIEKERIPTNAEEK